MMIDMLLPPALTDDYGREEMNLMGIVKGVQLAVDGAAESSDHLIELRKWLRWLWPANKYVVGTGRDLSLQDTIILLNYNGRQRLFIDVGFHILGSPVSTRRNDNFSCGYMNK
jgi:hypothetical protein